MRDERLSRGRERDATGLPVEQGLAQLALEAGGFCALTAGWATHTLSAARVTLPSSAAATTYRS